VSADRPPLLDVGQIVRPHGLKGLVVVDLWTNRPERMLKDTLLFWSGGSLSVVASSRLPDSGGRDRWLVSFEGRASREDAESLRGVVLRAPPLDDPGVLWVDQLLGAEVFDIGGNRLGVVHAVEANPASDLLVVDDGVLIPLGFVTDVSDGRVTVDIPAGLVET
jgi:16S rRNA processing protein RimM